MFNMIGIVEFSHDELAQLDVALLPERETMLTASGSAYALALAYGTDTTAETAVAAVADTDNGFSGAESFAQATASS
jgi:hypothetical protein